MSEASPEVMDAARKYFQLLNAQQQAKSAAAAISKDVKSKEAELSNLMVNHDPPLERVQVGTQAAVRSRGLKVPKEPKS